MCIIRRRHQYTGIRGSITDAIYIHFIVASDAHTMCLMSVRCARIARSNSIRTCVHAARKTG